MKQSPFWLAGAAVTLLATPAAIVAQADAAQDLLKEYRTKVSSLITEIQKQKEGSPEYQKAVDAYRAYMAEFGKRAVEAVRANPKLPAALNLLAQIMRNSPAETENILALVRTHYITDPKVGNISSTMIYSGSPAAEDILKEIASKNQNPDAKAQATYALGKLLMERFGVYAAKPVPENERDATVKRAEGYFKAVIALYASNPKHAMAEQARKDLIGLKNVLNLQIGKTAPEIAGEDVDGVKFKLSDYRGRVIMLDFWGNW